MIDSMWRSADTLDPGDIELEGRRFGGVRVLQRLPDTEAPTRAGQMKKWDRWECECLHCGNILYVSGGNLRRDKPQRSCGCLLPIGNIHYRPPAKKFPMALPRLASDHDFSI